MHGARVLYLQHANEKRNNFVTFCKETEKSFVILEFSMKDDLKFV
jgi:hypothetical protein